MRWDVLLLEGHLLALYERCVCVCARQQAATTKIVQQWGTKMSTRVVDHDVFKQLSGLQLDLDNKSLQPFYRKWEHTAIYSPYATKFTHCQLASVLFGCWRMARILVAVACRRA